VRDSASRAGLAAEDTAKAHKRDFWIEENRKHVPAHYRLQKAARLLNQVAAGRECDLLDVGCGPATLRRLLDRNIRYHGIDIAIHDPAPDLIETDFLENPIGFRGQRFGIVSAQGVFEYMGSAQDRKFGEIAALLAPGGRFVLSYTNFGHHDRHIFEAFSNVQPLGEFRRSLERHFTVGRCFPASHNWHGGQPARRLIKAVNMHWNANVPLVSPRLAVEYFFVCSAR